MEASSPVPGPHIPETQRRAADLLVQAENSLNYYLTAEFDEDQSHLLIANTCAQIAQGLLALNPPPRRYRPRPAPAPRVVKL